MKSTRCWQRPISKYVRVLFDTAHYRQGGGDPVAAIRNTAAGLSCCTKDVRPAPPATPAPASSYQFVELGRGRVDLPGVFAALGEITFSGIVELDRVPDPGRTPRESAEINKRYLVEKVHQTI